MPAQHTKAETKRKVVIAGGSGFIGQHLASRLIENGYEVSILTRDQRKVSESTSEISFTHWIGTDAEWIQTLENSDAVINLCGSGIADHRWSRKHKAEIRTSRIEPSLLLVNAIKKLNRRPRLFVQGSAIGFYGLSTAMNIDETGPRGTGFLARVCQEWETVTAPLEQISNIRLIIVRTGVVLGHAGGLFRKQSCMVRHFLGSIIGSGENWMSWIHIDDYCRLILDMILNDHYTGIVNAVSPHPVQYADFVRLLARKWRRPVMPAPPVFALRLALGDLVDELILASQHVQPAQAINRKFDFKYGNINVAVESLFDLCKKIPVSKSDC